MMLSIVTINFNNKAGLIKTAESIKCQSCKSYEWLVIDGGSTDGSIDVINQYMDLITYWVSEKDKGIYHAMNKGIDASKGEYIHFLNSGDEYHDENVISDFLNHKNTEDVIYGREIGVNENGKTVWEWQLPTEPLRLSYFWTHTLKHQATFFKRSCFEKYRYNENHKINSDVELFMTLLYQNYTFKSYNRLIAKFNIDGISGINLGSPESHAEFRDSLSRIMPQGIIRDIDDLVRCQDVDIINMTFVISKAPRFLRNILRIPIYIIYYTYKFVLKIKK